MPIIALKAKFKLDVEHSHRTVRTIPWALTQQIVAERPCRNRLSLSVLPLIPTCVSEMLEGWALGRHRSVASVTPATQPSSVPGLPPHPLSTTEKPLVRRPMPEWIKDHENMQIHPARRETLLSIC